MKKKIFVGLIFGVIAGIIDIVPMILKKLPWDANISAFYFWVISGFLISISQLKLKPIVKGVLIPFLVITPCAIIIGRAHPESLVPIIISTLILGSLLGYFIERFNK